MLDKVLNRSLYLLYSIFNVFGSSHAHIHAAEATTRGVLYNVKKVFLKISQISQENACVGVSF